MKAVVDKQKSRAIVYDASRMDCPPADFFSVDHWRSKDALIGEAVGRGSAWFLDTPMGSVVLRQYLRGGWVAKLSRKSYVFTGVSRSRPLREFEILGALHQLGLPVPRPVAAMVEFGFILSSGAILMEMIPSARTLADMIPVNPGDVSLEPELWGRVGKCIRRFHDAGVWHADLNARNILLDAENRVYLIDFDRARYTQGRAVRGAANLKRLKRSLVKLWSLQNVDGLEPAWEYLTEAYHG